MEAVDGGSSSTTTTLSLKDKRLDEIRSIYKDKKMTPAQRRKNDLKTQENMIKKYPKMKELLDRVNKRSDEVDKVRAAREKIVEYKVYSSSYDREIKITSESSRHWQTATVDDGGIVFLTDLHEFGEYDDDDEEPDEEFPDVSYPCAIIYTQSGRCERPIASEGGSFDSVLVVPDEIMNEKNEGPPGSFFSGRTVQSKSRWSPAPDGKVWCNFMKTHENPGGEYIEGYKIYFAVNYFLMNDGRMPCNEEKFWEEYGSLEYWCPVLHRFISDGERLRQEHWFHNGDGSANQRYFYNQIEMLDRHGGLTNLPLSVEDNELVVADVLTLDQVLDRKLSAAEKDGKVFCVE